MEAIVILRQCGRCGRDLTDAASIEHGMGPECRGKANEVLAKEIPARMNPDQAFLVLTLLEEQFPEGAREGFKKSYAKLLATKAFLSGEGVGQDVRSLVRELAWLLSWPIERATRYALLEAIKGLGYVAYAAFIEKAASASAATVELRGERVYLKAVRNKIGNYGMRLISGRTWHQESGEWSVPLDKAEQLFLVVRRCWPLTDLSVVEARVNAAKSAAAKPTASLVESDGWITIEAPYHRELVREIKLLPVTDRWWTGKAWRVDAAHQKAVEEILAKYFRVAA